MCAPESLLARNYVVCFTSVFMMVCGVVWALWVTLGALPELEIVEVTSGVSAPPTLYLTSVLNGGAPKQTPAAGWCKTRHNPKKAAQSGFRPSANPS